MSEPDTLELWLPHVGSGFAVEGAPAQRFELVSVTPGKPNGFPGRPPFALLFAGPDGGAVLPQATYVLTHGALGRREIFIVPIGVVAGRVSYQAVFG